MLPARHPNLSESFFVRHLHGYVASHVCGACWRELQVALGAASSLSELRAAHAAYLASAARLFRHDPTYRIPVKADPNIVVRHIQASHLRLAREMQSVGGLAIGGMYGVLPMPGDDTSWMVSMVGLRVGKGPCFRCVYPREFPESAGFGK